MTTQTTHTIRFLGTGASCGVPSFYCGCKACEEALSNPAARRGCSALLVSGAQNTLIDAGPDLRMQLLLAKTKDISRVILTHEHFDHMGGIAELEYYVRLRSKTPMPLYAGEHTLNAVSQQFAFMADTLDPQSIAVGQHLEFDGVCYTALPANHGTETFGFLIEKAGTQAQENGAAPNGVAPAKRVAYFPDTGALAQEVLQALKGIDVLIIDATFNKNNWMPASHHTIDEAIELAQQLGAKRTFLTHLAMHYDEPITARELQEYLGTYQGSILAANDGLEITL